MRSGNSIIPSHAEHDSYHAHVCAECESRFSTDNRPAGESREGDLCASCWAQHERWKADEAVTITLPLPPQALRPNARPHWAKKAKATKAYRKAAWAATLAATGPGVTETWLKASVQVVAYCSGRQPDPDNLIASLKAAFDGIADAGLIADDKDLWPLRPVILKDAANPRVTLTICQESL